MLFHICGFYNRLIGKCYSYQIQKHEKTIGNDWMIKIWLAIRISSVTARASTGGGDRLGGGHCMALSTWPVTASWNWSPMPQSSLPTRLRPGYECGASLSNETTNPRWRGDSRHWGGGAPKLCPARWANSRWRGGSTLGRGLWFERSGVGDRDRPWVDIFV